MNSDGSDNWDSDGNKAESSRQLVLHLLHELMAAQAQIDGATRLAKFTRRHIGIEGEGETMVAMEVASRALDRSIAGVNLWLNSQIVALHDPFMTAITLNPTQRRVALRGDDYGPSDDGIRRIR